VNTAYVNSSYGSNVELREQVSKKGIDYLRQNFVYSILENYNARVPDELILARESWWKDTLLTRRFGYNAN